MPSFDYLTSNDFSRVDLKQFSPHKDDVNCAAFSPDHELMVTGSDDRRVRVFNAVSASFVCMLSGHSAAVRCVAVSTNSKFIASGSYDKEIRIWVTRDASLKCVLQKHTKSVECVNFSVDSQYLCSGSWDRSAIIWDLDTESPLHTLSCHSNLVQCCTFSLDHKFFCTGSWDYTVRMWKLPSPTKISKVPSCMSGHTGNIHAVIFSEEGMLASGSWDRTVRLWNPRNSTLLHVLTGHKGWVQALCFTSDSLFIGSACDDDTVKLWDVVSGKCIKTLEAKTDDAHHCGFTYEGAVVAAGTASSALALL